MRFIIFVKATRESEAGALAGDEKLREDMTRYHAELARGGALLDASGLHPSSKGWRIRFDGERHTLVDGPFTEATELIAGYSIIQVSSREEALEWTRRFPNPGGQRGEIEVRQLVDLDELGQRPAVERLREPGLPSRQ